MHYNVITKRFQSTYNGRTRWITLWDVEVTNDRGTYLLRFEGRLCLKRGLEKLDQKIAAAEATQQAEAQAKAATLKKRYQKTWWGVIDNRTGKIVQPETKPQTTTPEPQLQPKPRPQLRRKAQLGVAGNGTETTGDA